MINLNEKILNSYKHILKRNGAALASRIVVLNFECKKILKIYLRSLRKFSYMYMCGPQNGNSTDRRMAEMDRQLSWIGLFVTSLRWFHSILSSLIFTCRLYMNSSTCAGNSCLHVPLANLKYDFRDPHMAWICWVWVPSSATNSFEWFTVLCT